MTHHSLSKRHYEDRPLAKLTEPELDVLDELGGNAGLFRQFVRDQLEVLGDLATQELAHREFERSRS